MPFYSFQNEATGEIVDKFFKINDRPEEIDIDGVKHTRIMSSPAIVSGVGGMKIPSVLKHRLTEIQKQHPNMKASAL